jgi:Fungal N-terminal domain of STAND proteins
MAEPLSVAASIVGVTVPALRGTRLLLDDLQEIIDAPNTVESLKEDIRSVDLALKSLQAVHDSEWKSLGGTVADESKVAIGSCTRACNTFRADLQRWTRHSEGGKLSWKDRANVGLFKQCQIKSTSEQLQTCKLTIDLVVGIATLYVLLG